MNAALSAVFCSSDFASLHWVSPRPPRFREFRDGAFLTALGLAGHQEQLRDFWPKGGPVWDGLAVTQQSQRFVLVEAKSYPEEVEGNGCKAALESRTYKQITRALDATANWLGIARSDDWLGPLYQSANRQPIAPSSLLSPSDNRRNSDERSRIARFISLSPRCVSAAGRRVDNRRPCIASPPV